MYRQGKKVQQRSSKSLQAMGETTESLSQILTGIRTVKAFQLEAAHMREFEATTERFLDRLHRLAEELPFEELLAVDHQEEAELA